MSQKLYFLSLGPGDYELVSLKAIKKILTSDVICVPTKDKNGLFEKSITYKIVKQILDEFNHSKKIVPIYSPMMYKEQDWINQTNTILDLFKTDLTVSYVTLGDAGIFSGIYYILEILKEKNETLYNNCEVVPGITSFSLASAKVKKPLCLGDSSLEIKPLIPKNSSKTTIYMRPKKGMFTNKIIANGEIYTFEELDLKDEKISSFKIEKVEKYMTLFIDFIKGK